MLCDKFTVELLRHSLVILADSETVNMDAESLSCEASIESSFVKRNLEALNRIKINFIKLKMEINSRMRINKNVIDLAERGEELLLESATIQGLMIGSFEDMQVDKLLDSINFLYEECVKLFAEAKKQVKKKSESCSGDSGDEVF